MPDPDVIAELTTSLRPDWTCGALYPERCEGRVVHYVHLSCQARLHRRQHAICAGHLQHVREGTMLDLMTYPGFTAPCRGVFQLRVILPIENIDMSDPSFLTLRPSS